SPDEGDRTPPDGLTAHQPPSPGRPARAACPQPPTREPSAPVSAGGAGRVAGIAAGPRRVSVARATPPTSSTPAHHRSGVIDSPRNRAADDIPKPGTSRENGATGEAGWRRSSQPQAPKPRTVATQATNSTVPAPCQSRPARASRSRRGPSRRSERASSG